jgi:hypothetical protein
MLCPNGGRVNSDGSSDKKAIAASLTVDDEGGRMIASVLEVRLAIPV